MMNNTAQNVFGVKFTELSSVARANAVKQNRYILIDDDEYCAKAMERLEDELESLGFTNAVISYCGFEGDDTGVNFTSDEVDFDKLFGAKKDCGDFSEYISKHGFSFMNISMRVSRKDASKFGEDNVCVDLSGSISKSAEQVAELTNLVIGFIKNKNEEIYGELKGLYFASITDDAVSQHLTKEELEFDSDGNIV